MDRYSPCAIVVGLLASVSGCTFTHTPYVRPSVPLPPAFEHLGPDAGESVRSDHWWRDFNDTSLNELVDVAIARNPELAAAAIRVRRANLQARLVGNALLPIASGNLSTGLSRPVSGNGRHTQETASGTLSVSWETDLFGRVAAERDAARFEALATAEDRKAAFLSLVGTAASLHWQMALANERIALGEQSLASARRTQELVEAQYRAGAVSALELREVEQTVASQQSVLSQLRQTRTEAREALMVLLNWAPQPGPEPQSLDAASLPPVAAGLPAELLRRRPDLRAADLRLRRALANSDAARASYYPSLALTGGLGTSSTTLLNLIANPVATLGVGPTLPFLNVRAIRFDTAIARTQYEEAVILFRKSLYGALAEVENALSARSELAVQGDALARARDAALDAERLYEIRYRFGAVPLRTWLDAQERRRSSDLALSANRLARLQNHITLYQALGGGFAP